MVNRRTVGLSHTKAVTQSLTLVRGWRRMLLIFYILLLGLLLPFICWGAWGTPGHPHAGPHFVFRHPPSHMAAMQAASAAQIAGNTPIETMHEEQQSPVGRSTPDTTSAISLILVPLLLVTAFSLRLRREIVWLAESLRDNSTTLLVPTPPPRFVRGN